MMKKEGEMKIQSDKKFKKILFLMTFLFFIFFTLSLSGTCSASEGVEVTVSETETSYGHELLWKEEYTGTFDEFGSVVVENGTGYVVGKGLYNQGTKNITAFNATNGNLIWTTYINNSDGTPLIDNQGNYLYINTYYSGDANGIYKISKTNGSIMCQNHTCSDGTAQSMAQSDDLIFDGCLDGMVYAYNKNDCTVNWTYNVSGSNGITSTPLYWEDTLTFGAYGGNSTIPHFLQLNATTGTHIWNNTGFGSAWDMQPSIKDSIIYMASAFSPYMIGAFNFSTGELIWNRTDIGGFLSQMAIYDNRLWVGGTNNKVYSLNLDDGTTNCSSYDTGNAVYQGPSIVPGLAFFGSVSPSNSISLINTTDCSLIWNYEVGAGVLSAPSISQGSGYFATDDYNVYAFDFGDGTGDWSYLGYNSSGQSFCSDCLTDWQYVKANCSALVDNNMTCTIENTYDHTVNVTLENEDYRFNWYNSSNDLVESDSESYTLEMTSSETETLTLSVEGSAEIDWNSETNLTEATDDVNSVAFSNDSNWIAYGSSDYKVYVHNVPYWVHEATLSESDAEIYSVVFSPDNSWIAYGGYDYDNSLYNVYIHNITDWELETTLPNATQDILSVAFSSDNNLIAYGGYDDKVYVHNIADWSLNTTLTEATDDVNSVAFSPDNNLIAYGSFDGVVYVHNIADWSLNTTLTESWDSIDSVAFSPDNNLIAYTGYNGDFSSVVFVHNIADWGLNTTLTDASVWDIITSVAFSQDNNWIAYGSYTLANQVYINNVSDWSLNTTLTEAAAEGVSSVAFSQDNNWIAYGGYDDKVYVNNMIVGADSGVETDSTAPQITILSPENTTYTTSSIDFNISADESLSYCKFTIDGWATNYTMTINASNTGANYTNSSIADGTYTARFWCNDTSNNINNTENITFTIDTSTGGGTSDTDTGTSGSGYPIFKPTQEQLERGYDRSLREKWKIQFKFENKTYTIALEEINNQTAVMNMSSSSGSEIFNLGVNETKKFNLNNDGYYDLKVFLKNIKNYYEIDLFLRFIHEGPGGGEELPETEEEKLKEKSEFWIIFIVLALIAAIIISKNYKKHR